MSTGNLGKIDKYLIVSIIVILILVSVVAFTANGVFRAHLTSQGIEEIEEGSFLDNTKLKEVYEKSQEKGNVILDLYY